MKRYQFLVLFILALTMQLLPCRAHAAISRQAAADSIRATLHAVSFRSDSIRILYDVYDLSDRDRKDDAGWALLQVARRDKNHEVMADMLRQLATLRMRNPSGMEELLAIAEELPEGHEKEAVKAFIKIEQTTGEATYLSAKERNEILLKYVKEDITPKHNVYEDLVDLYRVTIFLGKAAKGNLYLEYIQRLEKMIKELPADHYYLKNLFYTSAAIFYSQNHEPAKAVEMDRELLKQIDNLETKYRTMGRKYRKYDRYYYICYRRMLRNYQALSMDEVKDLYSRCARLAEEDEEVMEEFNTNGRVTAYRLLAERDYAGAIPYLKRSLGRDPDASVHRELLGFLVEAADSVGDKETLLSALKEYNQVLLEQQKLKTDEAYTELQMRYDVNALKVEKNKLEIEQRDLEIETDEKLISIILISVFALAISLMLLCRSYFRQKNRLRTLEEENGKLHENVENILNGGMPSSTTDLRAPKKEQEP